MRRVKKKRGALSATLSLRQSQYLQEAYEELRDPHLNRPSQLLERWLRYYLKRQGGKNLPCLSTFRGGVLHKMQIEVSLLEVLKERTKDSDRNVQDFVRWAIQQEMEKSNDKDNSIGGLEL